MRDHILRSAEAVAETGAKIQAGFLHGPTGWLRGLVANADTASKVRYVGTSIRHVVNVSKFTSLFVGTEESEQYPAEEYGNNMTRTAQAIVKDHREAA